MSFYNPWILFFMPFVVIWVYFMHKKQKSASFRFSSVQLFSNLGTSAKTFFSLKMIYVRLICLILMIFALARPQTPVKDAIRKTEGIDIVLTIDASTSMLAEDFSQKKQRCNRLDAVKDVLPGFINARVNDRLGSVVFASTAYTLSPLTLNHSWFLKNTERLEAGKLGNKTAIGSALAASLNMLRRSKAKSKIIILLTDGRNNAGDINPATAAEIAKTLNVKIYAIGAGSMGTVPYPIRDASGEIAGYENIKIDMDEDLLREIASKTGGRYFRVQDTASLKKVYKEIDRLEKAHMQEKAYDEYNEIFGFFLIPALLLLLIEIILTNTILRRIP